jgi:integrase
VSIDKRGNSWRARYRGPDGRERNTSFPRKIDAQRWLAEQKARMARGEWVDPAASRVCLGVVAKEWRATTLHLKPKTREGYARVLRLRVLPTWEQVPMSKISHDRLSDWIAEMMRDGLSPSYIRQAYYLLSSVCEYAIRTGQLFRNPTMGVKLPKPARAAERVFLTHEEVAKLAGAAPPPSDTFIRLLAYTGLRWGEATALHVRDVDLGRRRLDVCRAFTDIGGKLVETTPKTHQARTVPLSPWLCRELTPHVQERERDLLVFTTPSGQPLRKSNFRRRIWNPAVRAVGLDGLTPHGLRHTAASLFVSAGTPPKVVQRILGHASITITLDLYGHLYPEEMDNWA